MKKIILTSGSDYEEFSKSDIDFSRKHWRSGANLHFEYGDTQSFERAKKAADYFDKAYDMMEDDDILCVPNDEDFDYQEDE